MFGLGRRKTEARAASTQSRPSEELVAALLGVDAWKSAADVPVTTAAALGVPAVWAAVNFIAGTVAGLPLQVFRRSGESRERVTGGLAPILHDAVNDEMSSYAWRKYTFERVLTGGRAFTFIERNGSNRVTNLWPLDPRRVTVRRERGRTVYEYHEPGQGLMRYEAAEIIDLPFMLEEDGIRHRGPIATCRDAISLAIASTDYAAKFYHNGGVPPFAVTGGFQSGAAMKRAADDLEQAVDKAAREKRQALILPSGLEIKPIGGDPEKGQMIEAKRFAVEEIARIYSLPPTFLQDLSHGTFSNTEQQDLHFVKHTLKRWIEQFEQEMNLKLFGRGSRQYVEFNVDGLLRGDFKTRMEGHATAIQHGIETPNEARALENRPALEGGDSLLIQGATVPLSGQMQQPMEAGDG
jgi:HK97 family phage portal protein